MNTTRLIRSELRKLTSTKMPLAFLAVLAVMAGINAFAVIAGTDFDGSKAFISRDRGGPSVANGVRGQRAAIAGLFGAIAAAREYGHHTVVPTFLAEPRRHRAVLAQFGDRCGRWGPRTVGAGLTAVAVTLSLPTTDYGFLVSTGNLTHVLAASTLAGAAGAILGAGVGTLVRMSAER